MLANVAEEIFIELLLNNFTGYGNERKVAGVCFDAESFLLKNVGEMRFYSDTVSVKSIVRHSGRRSASAEAAVAGGGVCVQTTYPQQTIRTRSADVDACVGRTHGYERVAWHGMAGGDVAGRRM